MSIDEALPSMTDLQPENLYPSELIAQIAEAVGITDPPIISALGRRLREMPDLVALYRTLGAAGSATSRINALKPLVRASSKTLESLDVNPEDIRSGKLSNDDVMTPQLIWSLALMIEPLRPTWAIQDRKAHQKLAECIEATRALHEAALAAKDRAVADKKPGKGGKRRVPDRVLHEVTGDLLVLYRQITGRNVGISLDRVTKEPGGPLIRFLALCLPPLGWELTPKAIRSLVGRVRKHY